MSKTSLRELLAKGPVFVPCAYDCVSALTMQKAGFKALCLTSNQLSMSYIGMPDLSFLSFGELLDRTGHIASSVELPVIAAIDTGFGEEQNVVHSCKKMACAGVAAIILEDQVFPVGSGDVIPAEDFLCKVHAAVDALKGTDVMLIVSTSAYITQGKDEAVRRCNAAVEAGADITLVKGAADKTELDELAKRINGKKMYMMDPTNTAQSATFEELTAMGYELIACDFALDATLAGIEMLGPQILDAMNDLPLTDCPGMDRDYFSPRYLTGLNEWIALGQKYNSHVAAAGWILAKES